MNVRSFQKTRHLVFGALGQDGSYLAEKLDEEGNEVIGVIRNSSIIPSYFLDKGIKFIRGNILDPTFISFLLNTYKPTHVYNLASASSVSESFTHPDLSFQINLNFVKLLMDNIEIYRAKSGQETFLLQASSSEMFGPENQDPITESAPHDPRSPYAQHKSTAHGLCLDARENRDLKIATAILFNHESMRRPLKFVSRKITRSAFLISQNRQDFLSLGNIHVSRDWGYAPDYVEAMRQISANFISDDFIIATGELHSLEDLAQIAFSAVGIENYLDFISTDKTLFRKVDNSGLRGNPNKVVSRLGWTPKMTFENMIRTMVSSET